MKTTHTDEQIQAAIDAACRETHAKHRIDIGTNLVLDTKAMPGTWKNEAHARRDLLKFSLARLPEPTPPVVDGKTPGDIAYDAFINGSDSWEAAASAVLAAFGQPSLESAIARMEAVSWKELEEVWDNAPIKQNSEDTLANAFTAVRAHLLASARDVQTIQQQAVELSAVKAALSGRTVSCSQCNESARTIEEMRATMQIIYDATECCADGAPDASAHDKLCNEISSAIKPFLK
jgi:hypothetical protein